MKEPKGFRRARLTCMPDVSAASLVPFVRERVDPGTVMTDGCPAYSGLRDHRFAHTRTVLSANPDPAHVSMPAVHRVASLFKRWPFGLEPIQWVAQGVAWGSPHFSPASGARSPAP